MENPVMYVVKHFHTNSPTAEYKPDVVSEPQPNTDAAELALIAWLKMYPWYKWDKGNGTFKKAGIYRIDKQVGDICVWNFGDATVTVMDQQDNFICTISIWPEEILILSNV
jgi:hypothetical protein